MSRLKLVKDASFKMNNYLSFKINKINFAHHSRYYIIYFFTQFVLFLLKVVYLSPFLLILLLVSKQFSKQIRDLRIIVCDT